MDYYISQGNGQQQGPFKIEELVAHGLTPSTLVWRQGMSQWMLASAMAELSPVLPVPVPQAAPVSQQALDLQREIEKTKREIENLTKEVARLDTDNVEDLIAPPVKLKEKTRYDFPCPTWAKETWMVLACVSMHFMLGIVGATTFSYIYLDIVGFLLCFVALYLGAQIKGLNKESYAQGTPSRVKADKLALINAWLVSVTTLIGIVIILIQSGLDMASEGLDTGITYIVIYVVLMGLLWYFNFRPIKLDNYSRLSSPTLATNVRQKRIEEGDLLRWKRERRHYGVPAGDDDFDSDWDDDSGDFDWDFDSDDDDWGGGDSGGGGADSEW